MASTYNPTPLEDAYNCYILVQVFGLPSPPYNSNEIRISGRQAVPFLTTSGVDRTTLRSIWTVADPLNEGSLMDLSQFHLLLRSVAMAQAGYFPPNSTIEGMNYAVQQYASQQMPLPSFSNVEIPSVNQLMSTYGRGQNVVNNNMNASNSAGSIDDAFGNFVGTQDVSSLPSSVGMMPNYNNNNQQQQQSMGSLPYGGVHGVSSSSIASESLGNFQNAPLSNSFTGSTAAMSTMNPLETTTPVPSTFVTSGQVMSISDAFVGLIGVDDAPLQTLSEALPPPVQSQKDDFGGFTSPPVQSQEDEFGGFTSSAQIQTQQQAAPMPESNATSSATDFGGFQTTNQYMTSFNSGSNSLHLKSDVVPVPQAALSPQFAGDASATPSDVYGSVAGMKDASLPIMVKMSSVQAQDDEFGGFQSTIGETTAATGSQPIQHGQQIPIDASSNLSSVGPTMSVSDAFGALSLSDAALPSLGWGDGVAAADNAGDTPAANNDDDDEFGGFEGAANEQSTHADIVESSNGLPSSTNAEASESDDPFSAIQSSTNVPLSGLGDVPATNDSTGEDDFSNFQTPDPTSDTITSNPASTNPNEPLARAVSGAESFYTAQSSMSTDRDTSEYADAMQPPSNDLNDAIGPLPAPNPFSSSTGTVSSSMAAPYSNYNNVGQAPDQVKDDPFSAFDAIPTPQYEPVPPPAFGSVINSADNQPGDDENFGDIDEAPPVETQQEMIGVSGDAVQIQTQSQPNVESFEEEFGDFGGVSPSAPEATNDDDDFGDFGQAPEAADGTIDNDKKVQQYDEGQAMEGSGMPASTDSISQPGFGQSGGLSQTASSDDPFSAFDALSAPQVQLPLQSDYFQPTATSDNQHVEGDDDEDDEFGDFGGAPQATNFIGSSRGTSEGEGGQGTNDLFGNFDNTTSLGISIADGDSSKAFGSAGAKSAEPPANPGVEFGSFEYVTAINEHNDATRTEESFGNFGDAPVTKEESFVPNNETTDFGIFAEVSRPAPAGADDGGSPAPAATDLTGKDTNVDDDEFGDFGGASAAPQGEASQQNDAFDNFEDAEFGNFENAGETVTEATHVNVTGPAASPETAQTDAKAGEEFGDFDGSFQVQNDGPSDSVFDAFNGGTSDGVVDDNNNHIPSATSGLSDFGSFEGATTFTFLSEKEANQDANNGASDQIATVDSDFGDFGSFEQAPMSNESSGIVEQGPIDRDAGFSNLGSATIGLEPSAEDEWGDFEVVNAPPPVSSGMEAEFEASFGDFEDSASPASVPSQQQVSADTDAQKWRDRIRSLSLQLPEPLRRQNGRSGEHVNLGECFEVNIGMDGPLVDPEKRFRVERCIRLLELLSTSHAKLGSTYWEQCFAVVRDEMSSASALFATAKKLSTTEKNESRQALEVFAKGLTEYVRVVRSMVATIGDLLLLDKSAFLSIDTWNSTWCSLCVLDNVLEIEKLWKEIQKSLKSLGISESVVLATDSSLTQIRTTCSQRNVTSSLCHLTLQPLSIDDKQTTKSEVLWEGQKFMACSANFLANRCPFYYVNN